VVLVALAVAAALLMAFAADAEAQTQVHNCNLPTVTKNGAEAWGGNSYGQLGDGTNNDSSKPVAVKDLGGLRDTAAGGMHTLALKDDCSVWALGSNEYGQLGDRTQRDSSEPVRVERLSDVKAISAGTSHSLALRTDGTVWAWGSNEYGQLGDGTNNDSSEPVQVGALSGVKAISAGTSHSLALKSDGTVWAWGRNQAGQLGDGTNNDSSEPVLVKPLSGVKAIDAGGSHSLALKSDGTVAAWGGNWEGQLGTGTKEPHATPAKVVSDDPRDEYQQPLTDVKAISAGGAHSLALKVDGTVRSWGRNDWGELGNMGEPRDHTKPGEVKHLSDIKAIDAGAAHNLALKVDSTVAAWGGNDHGELGAGVTYASRDYPGPVVGLTGVKAIDAGLFHNLAMVGEEPVAYEDWDIPDDPYKEPSNHM